MESFLLIVIVCMLSLVKTSSDTGNLMINKTLQMLEEGEARIELNQRYRNVTLVLGNTGSGKSTLIQWIAGDNNNLISKETKKDSGEYIIDDISPKNRIGTSTTKSKTLFPELIIDERTNAAYYDCPGFSDTRGTSFDVALTYFIKKVTDYVVNVKMIFIVGYPSVRIGVDRQDFMRLLRHSVDLIKDIDKYKNSVALLVTKVDNQYIKVGKTISLRSDDNIIETIAEFLQQVKAELINDASNKHFSESATKFINILLTKENNSYTRIGIFRRPDEPGPLSKVVLLQEGKEHIETILYKTLKFTSKLDKDFGYTISDSSKKDVSDLVEGINDKVWSDIRKIAENIKAYYQGMIENTLKKIRSFDTNAIDVNPSEAERFSSKFKDGINIITNLIEEIKDITIDIFAEKINNSINALGVNDCDEYVNNIIKQGNYFNFLQNVSDKKYKTRSWNDVLTPIKTYLLVSKNIVHAEIDNLVEKINNQIHSNISNIAEEIEKHYQNKMSSLNINKLTPELDKGLDAMEKTMQELTQSTTAQESLRKIETTITHLSIDSVKIWSNLNKIQKMTKYLKYLQVAKNDKLGSKNDLLKWTGPFKETTKYIEESKIWYIFLNSLFDKLSEYTIQKEKSIYNVANIDNWGKRDKPQGIAINKKNFNQFLDKIKQFKLKDVNYDVLKGVQISSFRLEALNQVTHSMFKNFEHFCQSDKLFIKGNFIVFNDLVSSDLKLRKFCGNDLNSVYIFALNKLYIDKDLTAVGDRLKISVIAPTWEIIGNNKVINLSGHHGKRHNPYIAISGFHLHENGADGIPGLPGGSAGSFFGIGSEFINGKMFRIIANGGNGGDGQHGGHGADGRDGEQPSNTSNYYYDKYYCRQTLCEGKSENRMTEFKCSYSSNVVFIVITLGLALPQAGVVIYGKKARRGGNGGKGGKGGDAGEAGHIKLISLNNNPAISISHSHGRVGYPGNGGLEGIGGTNGDNVHMFCSQGHLATGYREIWEYERSADNGVEPSGYRGAGGDISNSILKTAAIINNPAHIINEYKTYLRDHLSNVNSLPRTKHTLNQFLFSLENNHAIKNMYGTLEFFDELKTLEEQFHSLNKENLILFYQTFLNRIKQYGTNPKITETSKQYKKAFVYLYTAALTKLHDLRSESSSTLIIDVEGYLDLVRSNIKDLARVQEYSNKVKIINQYKNSYRDNVDKKIEEAKGFIKDLIIPEIEKINKQIDNKIDLLINETIELQEAASKHRGGLINKRNQLANSLVLRGIFSAVKVIGQVAGFLGPVASAIGQLTAGGSSTIEHFALDDQTNQQKPFILPPSLKQAVSSIKTIKPLEKLSANIDGAHLIQLAEVAVDIGNKHKSDKRSLDAISKAVEEAEENIKDLKQYEDNIYNTLIPMIKNMGTELEKVERQLETKSQIALHVTNWQVQTSLKDMKLQILQLTRGFKIEGDMGICLEKLNEAMTTLINIYDHIQNYQEQQNLANYIADISSATANNIRITDNALNQVINQLEILIRSNVVLKQHNIAVDAFKQWVFPLADYYFSGVAKPLSLKLNTANIDNLISQAVEQIDFMKSKLVEYKTSVKDHDKYIHSENFDSEYISAAPFFVWKNNNHKNIISQLLSGQEIIVKSDITLSPPDKDAIKFNSLQINLKSTDKNTQSEINNILKGFSVSITHLGNSYYRYKDNYFTISSDSQTIEYSFEKLKTGQPLRVNNVYRKIKNGDFMLSPYAVWKIQLITRARGFRFIQFNKFVDLIDLELIGRGNYLDKRSNISNLAVNDHYVVDNTLF